jgi:invasion protein IalB
MIAPTRLTVALLAFALASSPVPYAQLAAQEAPAPAEPAAEAPAEAPVEAPAEPATEAPAEPAAEAAEPAVTAPPEPEVMEVVRSTHGDWEVRCEPNGDNCFLYQLARDANNSPVAEISLVKLPEGGEAAAGVTVVTPLGTFLIPGLGMQIDSGQGRQYEFAFCSQVGCFARFGLTTESINAMKRGRTATLRVAAVQAPDTPIDLRVSLTGFTAGFDALPVVELPQQPQQ